MILSVNYYQGALKSYGEKEMGGEINCPDRTVVAAWSNCVSRKGALPIDFSVPEWGVESIKLIDNHTLSMIAFVPDKTHILSELLNSGDEYISNRLICRYNHEIQFIKPPYELLKGIFRYPHFVIPSHHLPEIQIIGPRAEGPLVFSSRISFAFKE
jgi:hypothetical protein